MPAEVRGASMSSRKHPQEESCTCLYNKADGSQDLLCPQKTLKIQNRSWTLRASLQHMYAVLVSILFSRRR